MPYRAIWHRKPRNDFEGLKTGGGESGTAESAVASARSFSSTALFHLWNARETFTGDAANVIGARANTSIIRRKAPARACRYSGLVMIYLKGT